jgi:hypothetical protein
MLNANTTGIPDAEFAISSENAFEGIAWVWSLIDVSAQQPCETG